MAITEEIIHEVIALTRQAGSAIMEVYKSEFDIHIKDDNSPITAADMKANTIITEGLMEINPDIPILSEEGRDIPFSDAAALDPPPLLLLLVEVFFLSDFSPNRFSL